MGKIRIAIVTPGSFSIPDRRNSSVERVVSEVSERLKDVLDLCIFSKQTGKLPVYEIRQGITHIRPAASRSQYWRKVVRWLARLKPDLIQIENRPKAVRLIRKKYRQTPIWLHLHSTRFLSPPFIRPHELKLCLKAADKIVTNSRFLENEVRRLCPQAAHKLAVNYPGVDTERFISRWTPEGQRLRTAHLKELGYENKKIILYAGRLQKIKGVHHLLKAMPQIAEAVPETVLVIVGSAYYGKDNLTGYVKELHQMGNRLPKHVRFIPFVPHDEMDRWFRLADVAVVPSFNEEAFGLVNLEAMASGVPVIATRAGGMPEIVRHHENGILIDQEHVQEQLAKAVVRLLKDERLARQMGERARDMVESQWKWEHTANRWLRMVEASVRRKDGTAAQFERPSTQGMD